MPSGHAFAQKNDSTKVVFSRQDINEIVVTATRTERLASDLPIPVSSISKKQIDNIGSLRLSNVLAEQTGLNIISRFGTGIQMQGFNPDYTLILVDGEPIIGRNAGTLDLSRLAVGNIKQIEIVKGPSSSLYGSEALAGVVNIITENPNTTKANAEIRIGANNTLDLSANAAYKHKKTGVQMFVNRFATNGYSLYPNGYGQTVEPYNNYTVSGKINHQINNKTKFSLSNRYFIENQQARFDVGTTNNPRLVSGNGFVTDWSIAPMLTHFVSNNFKTTLKIYLTNYKAQSTLKYNDSQNLFDESLFSQTFARYENQSDYNINAKNTISFGLGWIQETLNSNRYADLKQFNSQYVFVQHDYKPSKRLNLIVGGRFDKHSQYKSQFSPKLSSSYQVSSKVLLRASVGVGFKAPDFRQLYLNFNNAIAGYTVFGSQELQKGIGDLQQQGQIAELLLDPAFFGVIKPESSLAFNLGTKIDLNPKITLNLNVFRNDVKDLIEVRTVARKTNGQAIFSYLNLDKIFTQGIETNFNYQINQFFNLSAGYQYLEAKDKTVIQKIKNGEVFARNPETLVTTKLKTSDYGGLFNRANHTANAKLFYTNLKNGINANVRVFYTSKTGFADRNGNAILDSKSEYLKSYTLINASAGKSLVKNTLTLLATVENITNFKNPEYMPQLAGRLWYISINYKIK